jgi:hypothetical protein
MQNVISELLKIINGYFSVLSNITPEQWETSSGPGKWTKKQILGHLIDSAANNHQRFVRAQFEDNPLIRYDQNNWVTLQNYKDEPAEILLGLWFNYNRHIAFILKNIPADKIKNPCNTGKIESFTLQWIAEDYIRHMKHHLEQIAAK